jgi:hypothetical protein
VTDISQKFALICAKEHLNTLITDYVIIGIDRNNLDKPIFQEYNTSSKELLEKLYELFIKGIEQKISSGSNNETQQ